MNAKIKYLTVFMVALALGSLLGYELPRLKTIEKATTGGTAELTFIFGSDSWTVETSNTYMNIGKRWVRNFKAFHNITGTNNNNNATFGYLGWVSLGNASVTAALTKLTTEATSVGATRKAFDSIVAYNNGTYKSIMFNATVTFTFTGTINLNAAGIHWSSISNSNNNMYAAFSFPSGAQTFVNTDQLIVKYYHRDDGT